MEYQFTKATLTTNSSQIYGWTFVVEAQGTPYWTEFRVTGMLVDAAGRKSRYPDGVIAPRDMQEAFAKRLAAAWNYCVDMTDKELGL